MNLNFLTLQSRSSRTALISDDDVNDWLGGEAWVTPQLFAIDEVATPGATRREDPASDWIPV